MDFKCLIYYVLSCIGGGFLSWLIFGNKSRQSELESNILNLQDSHSTILGDFNKYRTEAKAKIRTKDAEISLLKKKLDEGKRIQSNGNNLDEVEKWKRQVKSLEKELVKNPGSESKVITDLKAQLEEKNQLLLKKEEQLKKRQTPPANFNSKMSQLQEEEIRLLTKQLEEEKKKVKKLKSPNAKASELELIKLLRQLDKKKKKKRKKKKKSKN